MTDADEPDAAAPEPAAAPAPDPFAGKDWAEQAAERRSPSGDGESAPAGDDRSGDHRAGRTRVRVRRQRVSLRKLRRRRWIGIAMLVLGGVLVVGGVWIAVTGLLARSQLQAARTDVSRLRQQITAGNLAGARSTAHDLRSHADRAHSLTTGPAWAFAAGLPGGAAVDTVRTLADQVDVLASDVLPPLVDASADIDPQKLRAADGSIDLAPLVRVSPTLDVAVSRLTRADAAVAASPAHTQIGPVDHARTQLLDQLGSLRRTLGAAATAAHVAPTLLGNGGVKRYFVAFENDAEARGTGGLPGAFAIVRADHGKLTFERFENDGTLTGTGVNVDFNTQAQDPGSDYQQIVNAEYKATFAGSRTETDYRNSNLSPNFPFAAQIWMAMWKKYSGQQVDGAVALDPTALSYLLKVTGPATLPDHTQVTASNVVPLTQQTVYAKYAHNQTARKALLLEVAHSASERILDSKASTTALVKAGAKAADQRRLLLYSADPAVESQILNSQLSGVVPIDNRPYAGMSVVNLGGNKLDYYLHRSINWQATGCGTHQDVTVTIKLTNDAPTGLPAYVTERNDFPPQEVKPGDNRLLVSYYATSQAVLNSAQLDGVTTSYYQHTLLSHPLYNFDVELPRGATRTIVLHLTEPRGAQAVDVLRQPGVNPLAVTVREPSC